MNGSVGGGMNGSLFRPMHGVLVGGMIDSEYLGIGVSVRYPIKARLGRMLPELVGLDRSTEGR